MDHLAGLYDAFNACDIDRVLAALAPDVDWPNAWEGGRLIGHPALREYLLRQWGVVESTVLPQRFRELADGRTEVLVDQVVRDQDGAMLGEAVVLHTYTFRRGLVARMDVGDPSA